MTTSNRTRHYIILLMLLSGLLTNCVPYHSPKLPKEEIGRVEGYYSGKITLRMSPDNLKFKASGGIKKVKCKLTYKDSRWRMLNVHKPQELYEMIGSFNMNDFHEEFAYRASWLTIKSDSQKFFTVGAMPNPTSEPRTLYIRLNCGLLYYLMKVEQEAGPAKTYQPADSAFFADPEIKKLYNMYEFGY